MLDVQMICDKFMEDYNTKFYSGTTLQCDDSRQSVIGILASSNKNKKVLAFVQEELLKLFKIIIGVPEPLPDSARTELEHIKEELALLSNRVNKLLTPNNPLPEDFSL